MTNYNLEEFKTWLHEERNQNWKQKGDKYWTTLLNIWEHNNNWERVCQRIRDNSPAKEAEKYYHETVLLWMSEVDIEKDNKLRLLLLPDKDRERERETTTKTN